MKISANDMRPGNVLEHKDRLWQVVKTEHVKPGKGPAYQQAELKDLVDGTKLNERFRAVETVERVRLDEKEYQYLYAEGEQLNLMDQESFEQVQADKTGMGGTEKWLKGEEECVVTLWNGVPIAVQPPNFVELQITETDPGVRGDTSSGGGKPATLETGAVVRVPLFVDQGELIKVNSRTGEYISRA